MSAKRKIFTITFMLMVCSAFIPKQSVERAIGPYGNFLASAIFLEDARAAFDGCYTECYNGGGYGDFCDPIDPGVHTFCWVNGEDFCDTVINPIECP